MAWYKMLLEAGLFLIVIAIVVALRIRRIRARNKLSPQRVPSLAPHAGVHPDAKPPGAPVCSGDLYCPRSYPFGLI